MHMKGTKTVQQSRIARIVKHTTASFFILSPPICAAPVVPCRAIFPQAIRQLNVFNILRGDRRTVIVFVKLLCRFLDGNAFRKIWALHLRFLFTSSVHLSKSNGTNFELCQQPLMLQTSSPHSASQPENLHSQHLSF